MATSASIAVAGSCASTARRAGAGCRRRRASPAQALVPVAARPAKTRRPCVRARRWRGLPVELDVAVPVRDFRVRNLLALEPGQVIESQWGHGEDCRWPSGDVQLAWSEFEVVDTQLAVRVTRLA